MAATPEVLRFDDLTPHLLLKNGNFLYKIPFRGGFAVLKVYHGSRGTLGNVVKSVENVLLSGQSSYMPLTRMRTERECLEVWKKHGFRVFEVYDGVTVEAPQCPKDGYMLLEYVDRPKLRGFMQDKTVPEDERFALYRRWLVEWSRRHDLAIAEREPRLVHENGDSKHVMLMEDGSFLWFDFEMVWRSKDKVEDHVSHELVQYIWNLHKSVPKEMRARLLEETVAHYPNRARIEAAYRYFFVHKDPFHRLGRALDRALFARSKKDTSKYNVAKRLYELATK